MILWSHFRVFNRVAWTNCLAHFATFDFVTPSAAVQVPISQGESILKNFAKLINLFCAPSSILIHALSNSARADKQVVESVFVAPGSPIKIVG